MTGHFPLPGMGATEYSRNSLLFVADDPSQPFVKPTKSYNGDAGMDLYCSESVVVRPQQFAMVHSNVCACLPIDTWAMICGRSSSFHKLRLITNTAIIDNGFQGELMASVFNAGDGPVRIGVGDRIVQLILFGLLPNPPMWVVTSKTSFRRTDRGVKGFGSSGR